jgi:medium-chain acyl-[acyl-carrier-protein] hydrolase
VRTGQTLLRLGAEVESPHAVVCVPHAGAGTAVFRSWATAFADIATVWAACLPGREWRILEEPITTIEAMADTMLNEIQALPSENIFLFGHCSGALIAYELAHRLANAEAGKRIDIRIIVSAQTPPLARSGSRTKCSIDLNFDDLVRVLKQQGGTAAELLNNRDYIEFLMPVMKADLNAAASYSSSGARRPLSIPIFAFGGYHDATVSPDDLSAWQNLTTEKLTVSLFDSGHFYLFDQPGVVHDRLRSLLISEFM